MHHNYNTQSHSHLDRQSINRYQLSELSATDACSPCSPPWIQDLIVKKRKKLVDIVYSVSAINDLETENFENFKNSVNSSVKPELTSNELNISCVSSKSGKTSIGSNTSPTLVRHSPSASASSGALSECCQSCQSCESCLCQRDVPSHWESGFNTKKAKAVHLNSTGNSVNVPIVRSVSSSLTCRPCSRCLVSTCVDCSDHSDHWQSVSIPESPSIHSSNTNSIQCIDKSIQHNSDNNSNSKCCYNTSKLTDFSEEQIIPGLVAQRKIEILQRQVSESSYFAHSCSICGKTFAPNDDILWNNLVKEKMINEKIRDNNKSDYLDNNQKNSHHYEVIMDYKQNNSVNGFDKHSNGVNGVLVEVEERDDNSEYELQYGPGIVDKLKLKFMSISIQQQSNYLINNKLKRCSSLENIVVSNDSRHYQTQQSLQPHHQYLSHNKPSEANDLLPLLGKNGTLTVGSITGGGNRANGNQNQLSNRLYIQHNNNKNIYNSKSSATVPVIKRAKSMETLLFQDDEDKGRQPLNSAPNQSLSKTETPLCNQNDLQLLNDNNVLICDPNHSNNESHKSVNRAVVSQTNSDMKSASNVSTNRGLNDELPKPDTVKTYKRIFEPINANPSKNTEDINKTIANNINNKSKNNYKKSQPNSVSNTNVKRKPPVLRATNKSVSLKSQSSVNSVNSSPTLKSQSSSPQVIQSIPSPTNRTAIKKTPLVGEQDRNNNNNLNKISANNSNTMNTTNTSIPSVKKPPIAPKRASLTLKTNLHTGMSAANINKNLKPKGSLSSNALNNKVLKHFNNNNSSISVENDEKMSEKSPKPNSSDTMNDNNSSESLVTLNGDKQSSTVVKSQLIATNTTLDSSDSPVNKEKVIKPIANIKPFTQSKQSKDDSKSEMITNCQSVNGIHNDSDLGHYRTNEIPIEEKASIQFTDNNIVINNNKSNKSDNEIHEIVFDSNLPPISTKDCNINTNSKDESKNDKTCAVNDVNDENVSPNSCDIMVDKSKANNHRIDDSSQSTQTADVLKPSLLLNTENNSNNSTKSPISSLWAQQTKKSANSSTTTIVFDFRGKDVKSNLAVHPTPFGLSSPKRSANGSLSANDSEDDDNYSGSTDIPLPSGILFVGENIRIGKGSMLLTRNKKLTIQFNDLATKTFEYPSEASLLADIGISSLQMSSNLINDENKNETNNSVIESESSNTITSLTALKSNLALGGSLGGLGSYKPTLIDTPFELGVSRTQKTNPNSDIVSNELNSANSSDELENIKPANPDETTSWSTSSTASDLLF